MSTWYLDPVNGSDYRGGDSWTVEANGYGTDGVANGTTTFTSATANFTGMEGRYIWIGSNATTQLFWGTINSVSDANTVVLSGTVTAGGSRYFYVGGAWLSATTGAAAARTAPGDTIRIAKTAEPVFIGDNFTWTNGKANIRTGERIVTTASNWTKGTGMSSSNTSNSYYTEDEGYSILLSIPSAFTTGLMAYKDIDAIDLSGYTRVSITVYSSIALQSGDLSLLLDDTSGCVSPLETLVLSDTVAAARYTEFELTLSTPASASAITSVGIQSNRDFGAASIYIMQIYAYNTDDVGLFVDDMSNKDRWTASANITLANSTTGGIPMISITPAAGFTTGLACYRDFASTVDWSSYDYVYIQMAAGAAVAAGQIIFYIDDTAACVSPLESMTTTAILGTTQSLFHKFTISNKAALSAVKSIGFGFTADPGTSAIYIFKIFLGKTGGFDPYSIVGNDNTSDDWFAVKTCSGTNWIEFGDMTGQITGTEAYWSNTESETTSAYYREIFPWGAQSINESGTDGNPITWSGGWNTTSNERDGETWLDGLGYNVGIFVIGAYDYLTFNDIGFVRGKIESGSTSTNIIIDSPGVTCSQYALSCTGAASADWNITFGCINMGPYGIYLYGLRHNVTVTKAIGRGYVIDLLTAHRCTVTLTESIGYCGYGCVYLDNGSTQNKITIGNIKDCISYGISVGKANNNEVTVTGDITAYNTNSTGIYLDTYSKENFIRVDGTISGFGYGIQDRGGTVANFVSGPTISSSDTADIYLYTSAGGAGELYVDNVDLQTAGKEVVIYSASNAYGRGRTLTITRYGKTAGDTRIYHINGVPEIGLVAKSNTAEAESGTCIQCDVSCTSGYYVRFRGVFGIPTESSGSRTISFKIKKDGTYDGDARPKAAVFQNGYKVTDWTAITGDVTESYVAYTITATKLEAGYYELWFEVNGTTGNLYIDTITWT